MWSSLPTWHGYGLGIDMCLTYYWFDISPTDGSNKEEEQV